MESVKRAIRGAAAGVLASSFLGFVACATAGSRTGGADDTTQPAPARTSEEQPAPPGTTGDRAAAPPAPAPPPAPPSPPPAAAAPAPPSAPPPPVEPSTGAPSAAAGDPSATVAAYMADPQAIGRASQLFRAVCTGYCHSTQPTAERVAPNLFDCDWDHGGSDQEIFDAIAVGIPDTQMQGFGEKLPHEDLWKIVSYLRQRSTCK